MEQQVITSEQIRAYGAKLRTEEKGPGTVEKYLRDVRALAAWLAGEGVTKDRAAAWKDSLLEKGLAAVTVNSMLAASMGFSVLPAGRTARSNFSRSSAACFGMRAGN